jgi:hypothetical protein
MDRVTTSYWKFWKADFYICTVIFLLEANISVLEQTLASTVKYTTYVISKVSYIKPLSSTNAHTDATSRCDQRSGMHNLTLPNPTWELTHLDSRRIHFANYAIRTTQKTWSWQTSLEPERWKVFIYENTEKISHRRSLLSLRSWDRRFEFYDYLNNIN